MRERSEGEGKMLVHSKISMRHNLHTMFSKQKCVLMMR